MVKLIALILPLWVETFAVAATLGLTGLAAHQRVRVSLLFTAFEGLMPLVGLALGVPLGHAIGSGANFIAIAVLIGFGLYTLMAMTRMRPTGSRTSSIAGRWRRSFLV
jgi:manganese efflux pump family protein